MKVAGIIAEYNPFHNGHALLAEKARKAGATHIVAVMSGNFVQRGDIAVFSHGTRAEAALACGVDLVIQLPCVYALSGAQSFARAGVEILDALGCVDELVFGSECGDIDKIISAADCVYGDEITLHIKSELDKGVSFAAARENALRIVDAEAADIIKHPNNILGVEYVAAIKRAGSRMKPVTFPREGAEHDGINTNGSIASASYIRKMIETGGEWKNFVPEKAAEIFEGALQKREAPVFLKNAENAVLYSARMQSREDLAKAPDVSEGIENRIYDAARKAVSLNDLYDTAKTKRYSHARIRRIVLNSFLGITAKDSAIPVPYIRITGFNSNGAEILRKIKGETKLPVITKAADLSCLGEEAERIFAIECKAGDIYSLSKPEIKPCGSEKAFVPIISKQEIK